MATEDKPAILTIRLLDATLNQALREAAEERSIPVETMVAEAVREWLQRRDVEADLAAMKEVEDEETVPWEEVKEEMRQARADRRAE
jgi:hypothetical protein